LNNQNTWIARIAVAVILLAGAGSVAAQRLGHAGQSYLKEDARWIQQEANGQRFEIDSEVITVKFRDAAQRGSQEALHRSLGATELRRASTGFVDIEIPAGADVFQIIDAYLADPMVEIAEPNTLGQWEALPDDTQYPSQSWLPLVSAAQAWDINSGDPAIIVAVLDSGTEFSHEDLGLGTDAYQNVWLNPGEDAWTDPNDPATGNGVDDDMNGFVDDWKGWDFANNNNVSSGTFFHGTAVAGTVAAKTNNAKGVAGMAGGFGGPGVRVLIAGVGDSGPSGAAVDDGILYAADMGAKIIQLSLSVGSSAAIDAAVDEVYDNQNMLVICASGNSGGTSVSYPSSLPKVIAVGATTTSDTRAGFSQHGPDVELSAPGTSFVTLTLNNGYASTSGTSFSAPTVSGIAALMWSLDPSRPNTDIRQILRDTADKVGGYNYNWNPELPGHSFELGYGRVNAESALLSVLNDLFGNGFETERTSAPSAAP
jgi:subtilisin family serine protease